MEKQERFRARNRKHAEQQAKSVLKANGGVWCNSIKKLWKVNGSTWCVEFETHEEVKDKCIYS